MNFSEFPSLILLVHLIIIQFMLPVLSQLCPTSGGDLIISGTSIAASFYYAIGTITSVTIPSEVIFIGEIFSH